MLAGQAPSDDAVGGDGDANGRDGDGSPPLTGVSTRGVVAAADHRASTAGLSMLRAGGTAADAAVAAGAVLAVTSPHMCGLGGDLIALVRNRAGEIQALCGAGRAGTGADAMLMRAEDLDRMPPTGDIRAVTVPGCVDGWITLHKRYGALPLAQVLEPAITYAAAGFPASVTLAHVASDILGLPGAEDFTEPAMATGGRLAPGTVIRRPAIGTLLTSLASDGRDAFYLGAFGSGLVELGLGLFSRADLARHQAEWMEPLSIDAWGHRLWSPPPPSQAYLVLAGAFVADALGVPDGPDQAEWAHLLAESARVTGQDRPQVLHEHAVGAELLAQDRLRAQAAGVGRDQAGEGTLADEQGDTTALTAVDRDGLAVSLVQSNASGFGSRVIEPETTVFLHNRGIGFSLEAGHPAELRPGERPPHTLSPILATRPDGSLAAVAGTMGGDAQPQILLQVLARCLVHGQPAGEAISAARWILGDGGFGTWDAGSSSTSAGPHISLERDAPAAWLPGLTERGHHVVEASTYPDPGFGHAQLIAVSEDAQPQLTGAADPRSLGGSVAAW